MIQTDLLSIKVHKYESVFCSSYFLEGLMSPNDTFNDKYAPLGWNDTNSEIGILIYIPAGNGRVE